MHTFRFHFKGRDRYEDADNIFEAMAKFAEKYGELVTLEEILVTKLA